jgi:hypothetical protein
MICFCFCFCFFVFVFCFWVKRSSLIFIISTVRGLYILALFDLVYGLPISINLVFFLISKMKSPSYLIQYISQIFCRSVLPWKRLVAGIDDGE